MEVHAQPCFDDFSNSMRSVRQRKVRGLHLTGHGTSRCGFYWLKRKASSEYEAIAIDRVVALVKTEAAGGSGGGTIEFAMLNACETEEMGKALRAAGVRYVICWRSEVDDDTAREFALEFYRCLDQQDPSQAKDYKLAFRQAVARMGSGGGAARRGPQKHLAAGAVDYVCLLSEAGDEFPNSGRVRGLSEEEESDTRNMAPPRDREDFGALAGQQELLALEQLGFDTRRIRDQSGLDARGFATPDVLRLWGVANYSHMWGSDGRVVQAAAAAPAARAQHALACLRKALDFRTEDMKKHARSRRCRGECAAARNCRDCRSRDAHAFMHRLMGEALATLQGRAASGM